MSAEQDVVNAYGLGGMPFPALIATLFVIVLLRSHGTYWLGRGLTRGVTTLGRSRRGPAWWHRMSDRARRRSASPGAQRAVAVVRRWGAFAVAPAYLFVGAQTAIFTAAGLTRMPYGRFTLASIPGSVAWALIWGSVGLGAVWAALALAATSPWALAAAVVALLVLVVALVVHRHRLTDAAAGAARLAEERHEQGQRLQER